MTTHSRYTVRGLTRAKMSPIAQKSAGFTLVELLVVITIIGMLVALLLPAVNAARGRAMMAQCANNQRNLGQAMINFESSKGNFPGYVQPVKRSDSQYVTVVGGGLANSAYTSGGAAVDSRVSWAARILPQLERQDLWDRMVDGNFPNDPIRPVEVFVCPADTDVTVNPDNAGLSYVANAGAWDWNNNTYEGDGKENGLFHNWSLSSSPVKTRLAGIRDGASTTLMLAENNHKNQNYSWLGVGPTQKGEQHFGMVWVWFDLNSSTGPSTSQQARFSQEGNNTNFLEDDPVYARPASNHPAGAFNVIFADGHGLSIQPDIDYLVYQQLMTPNGRKCFDPQNTVGSDIISGFRTRPPISEADYQ